MEGDDLEGIGKIQSLTTLKILMGTLIKDKDLTHLKNLKLKKLDLKYCYNLTYKSLEILKTFTSLKKLTLTISPEKIESYFDSNRQSYPTNTINTQKIPEAALATTDLWKFTQLTDLKIGFSNLSDTAVLQLIKNNEQLTFLKLTKDSTSITGSFLEKIPSRKITIDISDLKDPLKADFNKIKLKKDVTILLNAKFTETSRILSLKLTLKDFQRLHKIENLDERYQQARILKEKSEISQ